MAANKIKITYRPKTIAPQLLPFRANKIQKNSVTIIKSRLILDLPTKLRAKTLRIRHPAIICLLALAQKDHQACTSASRDPIKTSNLLLENQTCRLTKNSWSILPLLICTPAGHLSGSDSQNPKIFCLRLISLKAWWTTSWIFRKKRTQLLKGLTCRTP